MEEQNEIMKKALRDIARILDNIKYELAARVYTLDDDQMSWVFYCRDLAQKTLRDLK